MKKNILIRLFILVCLSFNFVSADSIKIGLGSCIDQDFPQPIWNSIENEGLSYFIFLGDNVYGDIPSGSLKKMQFAYEKQASIFPDFLDDINIFSIWDDHDYGKNDGGKEYKYKKESQKMFLDFWNIPKKDIRHKREGIYFSEDRIFFERKFKFIFLDTRYFRSNLLGTKNKYIRNEDQDATILGIEQWEWFENEVKKEFDFLIIFSSIQIIPEDHSYEKWGNFPLERNKLFNILEKNKSKTLLVSGDRHRGGIYKKNDIFEITASSLNKPGSLSFETDKYLIGETYPQENFGVLEVLQESIDVKLKDKSGKNLNSISFKY